MTTSEQLRSRKPDIERIARKYGVRSVRVFGSVARGAADEASDVDLLVEVEKGTSLLSLGGFQVEMEELLGKKVDVVTEDGLKPRMRDQAVKDAVAL